MAEPSTRTTALYQSALVWDMTVPGLGTGFNRSEVLLRYREAGYTLISVTVATDKTFDPGVALKRLAGLRGFVQRHPDELMLVGGVADIDQAKRERKLAVTFNLQGTNPLAGDVSWVEPFYRLGVTHMLLAYNQKNLVGDGCAERTDAGLSRFGMRLIREMNRVGMLVDGSHSGYRTTMEAIEACSGPFIFSHANARAVFDHYRNIRDDQIRACAASGGVIGINGCGDFLAADKTVSAERIFQHIDHVVSLVGARHAGIALDFIEDGARFASMVGIEEDQWPPNGGVKPEMANYSPPEIVPEVVDLMLARGYADDDVRAILGGNFRRVAGQVWR